MTTLLLKNLYTKKSLLLILLGIFLVATISVYIMFSVGAVRGEYKLKELQGRILDTEKLNNKLRINLTSASSLDHILEISGSLSYVEIKKVNYIEKSGNLPFAIK